MIPAPTHDAAVPGPRFVPGQLVHKTMAGRVLLTDAIRLSHDRFLLAAMLPAGHGLYRDDGRGWTDPMLMVEAVRQAGYCISHRFYGVPDTHRFIFGGVTLGADDTAPLASGTPWLPVNLRVSCTPTAKWTRRRLGMRLEVELSVAGGVCGHGGVLSEAVDPRMYRALRRRAAPPDPGGPAQPGELLPPGDVGRRNAADVLLADDGHADGWLLRVDQRHPVMFDHPVDHVPGMVLLEAFRQAAIATARPPAGRPASLTGLRTTFARFCELDAPARISARVQHGDPVAGRTLVQVTAEQAGAEIAAGLMEVRLDEPEPVPASTRDGRARAEEVNR